MKIKENSFPYGGFELDASRIGNKSLYNDHIFLPYDGPLPAGLTGSKAAIRIIITISLGVNVVLCVRQNGVTGKFLVEATGEEINRLLHNLFFELHGDTWYTRTDCGLSRYWLGFCRCSYEQWKRLTQENDPLSMADFLRQFSPEKKAQLMEQITEMCARENA